VGGRADRAESATAAGAAASIQRKPRPSVDRPSANVLDRYGREAREIRGLSVEEHINRLSQDLIPLAERCARTIREALSALETP
jgi:hypothetical protein